MSGFFAKEDFQRNELDRRAAARRNKGLELLDLTDANPTNHGLLFPRRVLEREAARALSARKYTPDPKGLLSARTAISEYYRTRTSEQIISAETVIITAGTSEAYSRVFSLLCDPGDALLAPDITYPLLDLLAEERGVQLAPYRISPEGEIDPISLRAGGRTRGLLLISPHNPTGGVQRTRVEQLARLGLPLIVDEVFSEFVWGDPVPPLGALYPDLPVFHLNGISKMFALPDLKVGWIALNEPAARSFGERLEFLNDLYLSASQLTQEVLPAIFSEGWSFVADLRAEYRARLTAAEAILRTRFDVQLPAGGTFLFPALPKGTCDEEFALACIEHGVLIHPGHFYNFEGRFVVSCVPRLEILKEGCRRIVAA